MDFEKLTDRNVEQLDFAAENLAKGTERQRGLLPGARSLPGSRPDGGMEPLIPGGVPHIVAQAGPLKQTHDMLQQVMNTEAGLRANLVDARNIIDNFERDMAKLESELASTKILLDEERRQREELEGILRKAAEIMINGRKS